MPPLLLPVLFTPEVIRKSVLRNKTGVYLLGNDHNGFEVGYVGRSDTCLRIRLLSHNHMYKYDYIVFMYSRDAREAFWVECQYWHTFRNRDLSNLIHPASPKGSHMECPYCHFVKNVTKLLV